MIVLLHNNDKIIEVLKDGVYLKTDLVRKFVSKGIMILADEYREDILVWCHISLKDNLNLRVIPSLFNGNNLIYSYHTGEEIVLSNAIGYVEQTPFVNINKKVRYPTWIMSSDVGAVQSKTLINLKKVIKANGNFDYLLNSIAKKGQPLGLLCYSEPALILHSEVGSIKRTFSSLLLFRFVRQHYKFIWIWLLFIDFLVYEKRFKILPLLFALVYRSLKWPAGILITNHPTRLDGININPAIDVIIPTYGRKKYLYEFLTDLNEQTLLPLNVIVVEQNPDPESQSELDYIDKDIWKFNIIKIFTHITGACNARNIAIEKLENDWAFFADDDIRISTDFLMNCMEEISLSGYEAFTVANKQPGETLAISSLRQFEIFGTCSSIVKREAIDNLRFDLRYEFGFGEDVDFGMKLRNKGVDIIYLPYPVILHLKAPSGGFRVKYQFPWNNESILPKPSPTIMLYNILHSTPQQISGYKTISFFKFYKSLNVNPIEYTKVFKARWQKSHEWAMFLIHNNQE